MYFHLNSQERNSLKTLVKYVATIKVIRKKFSEISNFKQLNKLSKYGLFDIKKSLMNDENDFLDSLIKENDEYHKNILLNELKDIKSIDELLKKYEILKKKYISRTDFVLTYTFMDNYNFLSFRIEDIILEKLLELCAFSKKDITTILYVINGMEANCCLYGKDYSEEYLEDYDFMTNNDIIECIECIANHFKIDIVVADLFQVMLSNTSISDSTFSENYYWTAYSKEKIKKIFEGEYDFFKSYKIDELQKDFECDIEDLSYNFYDYTGIDRQIYIAIRKSFNPEDIAELEIDLSPYTTEYDKVPNYIYDDSTSDGENLTKIILYDNNERDGLSPLFLINLILIFKEIH